MSTVRYSKVQKFPQNSSCCSKWPMRSIYNLTDVTGNFWDIARYLIDVLRVVLCQNNFLHVSELKHGGLQGWNLTLAGKSPTWHCPTTWIWYWFFPTNLPISQSKKCLTIDRVINHSFLHQIRNPLNTPQDKNTSH